jgi:hypothetical protein
MMTIAPQLRTASRFANGRHLCFAVSLTLLSCLTPALLPSALGEATRGQAPSSSSTTSAVTIVLPPRVVAGQPATLAVLGVDGRLASGVNVNLGRESVTTDRTGRASFTAPEGGVLLATASGASVAALVDPPATAASPPAIRVAPVVSLRDRFSICGAAFAGDANANRVKINGQPALALAASPECIVVLPGPKAEPGPATVSIESAQGQWSATTSLVSIEFEAPNPPLLPGKKSQVRVQVQGSGSKLQLLVENTAPGVLQFLSGDLQEVVTSGGPQNFASLKIETIRSGDFSFHARLLPAPDPAAARRYLVAAALLAPRTLQGKVRQLAGRLSGSSHNSQAVRRELDRLAPSTAPGDFRALLDAARAAL